MKNSQWFYDRCKGHYISRSGPDYIPKANNHPDRNELYKYYVREYGKKIVLEHIKTLKQIFDDIETKAFQSIFMNQNPPGINKTELT